MRQVIDCVCRFYKGITLSRHHLCIIIHRIQPMLVRRLILVLFALLQCLSPLLHAHGIQAEHHGVHFPELATYEFGHGLAITAQAIPDQAGIGVASCLEARHLQTRQQAPTAGTSTSFLAATGTSLLRDTGLIPSSPHAPPARPARAPLPPRRLARPAARLIRITPNQA